MLLNSEIRIEAIRLLKEIKKSNWHPTLISFLEILLDRKKSETDLQKEIPSLTELTKNSNSAESAQAFYFLSLLHQLGLGVELDKKLAAQYLELAANGGLARAQVKFGQYLVGLEDDEDEDEYSKNEYIEKDVKRGMDYLQTAQIQEYPAAKFALAGCYLIGCGVTQDLKLAMEYFRSAAEQGDIDAQLTLGGYYAQGEIEVNGRKIEIEIDLETAARYYTLAAKQGDPEAQYILGYRYEHGKGVELDLKQAIEWYRLAAEQGCGEAQYMLGYYYQSGVQGVEQDLKQAMEWYSLAAEQGNNPARNQLGYCYQYGQGVEKDLKRAVEYFSAASEQGDVYARVNLGRCYESQGNFERAVEYFELAALQGEPTAKCYLGNYYEQGQQHFSGQTVIRKDLKRALDYYRQAAEETEDDVNNNFGRDNLTVYYSYTEDQELTRRDLARSTLLFESGGKASNKTPVELPRYLDSENLKKSLVDYQSNLEKEVKNGAERAVIYGTVGFCHQLGLRTPKNLAKAALFYTEAMNGGVPDALWDLFSCYREMSSDEGLGTKRLLQFYKDLETPYDADPKMERERLLLLAYLYENGGPYFEQDLFKALTHYQLHSVAAQGIAGVQEHSQGKVQVYTPLLALKQSVKQTVVDDSVPCLEPFDSILTQYVL